MEMTSADLFQVGNSHYLLLVDRYSGFPLVAKLSSLTSKSVVERLHGWFELVGFPCTIQTDGDPQFCLEFRSFCDRFSVIHELSSPYHPSSNGSAGAAVKNMKAIIIKISLSLSLYIYIYIYIYSPQSSLCI